MLAKILAQVHIPSLLLVVTAMSCMPADSQTESFTDKMPSELNRRIEVFLRNKAQLPFNYEVRVGDRRDSSFSGFDEITVMIGEPGKTPKPMHLYLSKDNNSLAQIDIFDISRDPRSVVGDAGRPFRGGSESAPVKIVIFDDLQCPFCARMNQQLFPAVLNRYGDSVRITHKDFPLDQHLWAIHAAVAVNCLGEQSNDGYWKLSDYLHAHFREIGGERSDDPRKKEQALTRAKSEIDRLTMQEGMNQKVSLEKLSACMKRPDIARVKADLTEGESLNISAVPVLYINGQALTGAVPIEYVYSVIDKALEASGVAPPAPIRVPILSTNAP